jgi:hypothetical protein
MDVEIFPKNELVPLVLCVKDAIVVVCDLTLLTNFKVHINSILLEKIVLNYRGGVTQVVEGSKVNVENQRKLKGCNSKHQL